VTRGSSDEWSLQHFPAWIHVLAFNAHATGWLQVQNNAPMDFAFTGHQPSHQLQVHDKDVPDSLLRVVKAEILPWLAQLDRREYLVAWSFRGNQIQIARGPREPVDTHFVTDADGHIIAGHYAREDSGASGGYCMILPFMPKAPERWLLSALEWWRELTPERFIDMPSWQEEERWQTVSQITACAEIASLSEERFRIEADLRRADEKAQGILIAASAAADAGPRRLLTQQGDALVAPSERPSPTWVSTSWTQTRAPRQARPRWRTSG
jgi:hypothetical protein